MFIPLGGPTLEELKVENACQTDTMSQWKFQACKDDLVILTEEGEKKCTLSACNTLFKDKSDKERSNKSEVGVKIVIQKELLYDRKLGCYWHKSWNIPNILVTLEAREALNSKIVVEIFAVKAKKVEDNKRILLIDVGLRGINKKELIRGSACFSSLKFITTSYYNEDAKFFLLVRVLEDIGKPEPHLISALISAPIFVDSRKMARDSMEVKKRKSEATSNVFPADVLQTNYFKRTAKCGQAIETVIDNSFQGLFDYLTAPNIRHKVRHPIFFAIKFSQCVKLYYNPLPNSDTNLKQILMRIQNALDLQMSEGENAPPAPQVAFLLIVPPLETHADNINKVLDGIGLRRDGIGRINMVLNPQHIPVGFYQITDLHGLQEAAKEVYGNVADIQSSQSKLKYGEIASSQSRYSFDYPVDSNIHNTSHNTPIPCLGPTMYIPMPPLMQIPTGNAYVGTIPDPISELLMKLSVLSNSVNPLKKVLPMPNFMRPRSDPELMLDEDRISSSFTFSLPRIQISSHNVPAKNQGD